MFEKNRIAASRLRDCWKCCLFLVATLTVSVPAAERTRPNVLFIIADDLRPTLGAYGDAIAQTPQLDALAAKGVRFTRAYCQQALCAPSRVSALSGLRPDTVQVWDLAARMRERSPDVVTLPELFRRSGYETRSIGKVFHNETRLEPGRVPMSDPQSWSSEPSHTLGAHWQDDPTHPRKKAGAWQMLDVSDEAYFDGKVATAAVEALNNLSAAGRPFFLAVGFWKPHLPFNAPKKYWDLYDPAAFRSSSEAGAFPVQAPAIAKHSSRELRTYRGVPKEGELPEELASHLRHGYYACVSFLDVQVGRVLSALDRLGLRENTIIVLWGDHGFQLGEHEMWGKTSNYELDARVPLIIAGPGVHAAGAEARGLVEMVDVYPTLAELAALPVPANLDGRSFARQLRDPAAPGKTVALTQHPQPSYSADWVAMGYSLRDERYRYIEWHDRHTGEITARELYDHANDAAETRNVIDDPAKAAEVVRLAGVARQLVRFDPNKHAPAPRQASQD